MRCSWLRLLLWCAWLLLLLLLLTALSWLHSLFSPSDSLPQSSRARGLYSILMSNAIESKFLSLEVYNCSQSPVTVSGPRVSNRYWQRVDTSHMYLYSAYYDARYVFAGETYHYVRVIGMSQGKVNGSLFCSLWYQGEVVVVSGEFVEVWLAQWNPQPDPLTYHTYLFTCPIPLAWRDAKVFPQSVSLSRRACGSVTNSLKVHRKGLEAWQRKEVRKKKTFAVCVKGLNFEEDISYRLVEWLELLGILGADLVVVYKYWVPSLTDKTLDHYAQLGRVRVINLTLPGDQPNEPKTRVKFLKKHRWQKRRNELVPYNDCLYQNLYLYDYVVPLDVDEVIVPVKQNTWHELLSRYFKANPKHRETYASFSVQNTYFLDVYNGSTADLPAYLPMLRHVTRSANFSLPGHSVKSFVSTASAATVFNHYTHQALYRGLRQNVVLGTHLAQMNHYKSRCPRELFTQCHNNFLLYTKKDDLLHKYKDELVPKVKAVIDKLKL